MLNRKTCPESRVDLWTIRKSRQLRAGYSILVEVDSWTLQLSRDVLDSTRAEDEASINQAQGEYCSNNANPEETVRVQGKTAVANVTYDIMSHLPSGSVTIRLLC